MGHIGRLRGKQSEQSLIIEQLNKEISDADLVVKAMMTQAGQYLDSFIQLLNSSATIKDLLSVTFKERLTQLKRGGGENRHQLLESILYLQAFQALMSDLDQTLSTECLDAKQSLVLADIKLKRLESYVGHSGSVQST